MSEKACSSESDAPKVSRSSHFAEKANFAGSIIGGMSYGVVIVLFFRCMGALSNPGNRMKEGVKWGLVTYTAAMFSFVTIFTATNLCIQSLSYIGNQEFPCGNNADCPLPPGNLGKAISVCRILMFFLNSWLADGLLLYRCYVIYAMNCWVIVIPCLMYLATFVMGIMLVYHVSQPDCSIWNSGAMSFGLPYFSISVSLNILLTLMIVARLALHITGIRNIMGPPARASRLYQAIKAIVIVLAESSALYAVNSLLFIGLWGAGSHVADIFLPILAETQVIASLLVTRRFADRSTLTNSTIASGDSGPVIVGSQGNPMDGGGGGIFPSGYPMRPVASDDNSSSILVIGVETTIDVHHDRI